MENEYQKLNEEVSKRVYDILYPPMTDKHIDALLQKDKSGIGYLIAKMALGLVHKEKQKEIKKLGLI